MNKTITITFLFMVSIATGTFAQEPSDNMQNDIIGINSAFSYKMLEPNEDLRKVNVFIEERKSGNFENGSFIIGSSLIALGDYQKSNTDSKFGYLMRHPTSSNQIGTEVSEAVVHSFQLSLSGSVNNWLAAYAEMLYNPEQSFGSGIITSLERNQIQLRKGFLLFGDLNKCPLYGAVGKMDAPFGQTGTVSPFTNSTMWHAFGGLGYGAQLGFKKWNVHATLMAVQGGAQFRAMNTPVGDSTNVPSQINNFTADLNYTLFINDNVSLMAGGSYLHGSAYYHEFPVIHFDPSNDNNPAWTVYGKLIANERLTLKAGFAKTLQVWPGTHNPTAPLDIYEASHVSSFDAGAKYTFDCASSMQHSISGEFSNFIAGPSGAPWERQNQIVLGYSVMITNSSKLFVELFRTDGYVPLNFISGFPVPDVEPLPPAETHSVRDAISHGVVIGGQITF